MPNHESGNLEPPPRTSIDDPGAHELGLLNLIRASAVDETDEAIGRILRLR
jgi:hypothetical protein